MATELTETSAYDHAISEIGARLADLAKKTRQLRTMGVHADLRRQCDEVAHAVASLRSLPEGRRDPRVRKLQRDMDRLRLQMERVESETGARQATAPTAEESRHGPRHRHQQLQGQSQTHTLLLQPRTFRDEDLVEEMQRDAEELARQARVLRNLQADVQELVQAHGAQLRVAEEHMGEAEEATEKAAVHLGEVRFLALLVGAATEAALPVRRRPGCTRRQGPAP